MKRFSVSYKLMAGDGEVFSDIVADYRGAVREVYFAWPGEPSGRAPLAPAAQGQVSAELRRMKRWGIRLNLLFNASCYGEQALAGELADRAEALVRTLSDTVGLEAVTTLSPLIAGRLRRQFSALDIRASVNMRLGTVPALSYVRDVYSSYTVQREINRDPARLAELQDWAVGNGKELHVLANSGCLAHCSFQMFHDNAVAHEAAIARRSDNQAAPTLCRSHYAREEARVAFLQGTWIRPEDIVAHSRLFAGGYKLATRLHDNPRLVIDAYARGRFYGNLLDLMEPGFGPLFHPQVIANTRFPPDWLDRVLSCDKRCHPCSYCRSVLKHVLIHMPEENPVAVM